MFQYHVYHSLFVLGTPGAWAKNTRFHALQTCQVTTLLHKKFYLACLFFVDRNAYINEWSTKEFSVRIVAGSTKISIRLLDMLASE